MDATRCLDDYDPDFKYTDNANISHSWLINYPDKLKPNPNSLKISSTNETFVKPTIQKSSTKGKRKKIIEAFFRKIISDEAIKKYNDEVIEVEAYETDYTEHYKNPDDMPIPGEGLSKNEKFKMQDKSCPHETSKINQLEKLKAKYPLYLSTPLTFFSQTTGKKDFKRNSTITRPPEKNYDNIEY